jgi:hypothetical protein
MQVKYLISDEFVLFFIRSQMLKIAMKSKETEINLILKKRIEDWKYFFS